MTEKRLTLILFLLLSYSAWSSAQNLTEKKPWKYVLPPIVEHIFVMPKAELLDSLFVLQLDSLILSNKEYQYSGKYICGVMSFKPELKDSTYSILLSISGDPEEVKKRTPIGYFTYKEYTILMYGETPERLFRTTKQRKRFKYETGGISYVSDIPEWFMHYTNRKLKLIEVLF